MAERPDGDERLAARYRALAREEPPAAIDDAVRAAARRAVHAGPRSRLTSRRWAIPASIAAVLVLTFGITMRMQLEQPGVESTLPTMPSPMAVPQAEEPAGPASDRETAPDPKREAAQDSKRKAFAKPGREGITAPEREAFQGARRLDAPAAKPELKKEAPPAPFRPEPTHAPAEVRAPALAPAPASGASPAASPAATSPVPSAAATSSAAPAAPAAPAAQAAPAAPAPALRAKRVADPPAAAMADRAAPEAPERKLERIAELRREGRHAEADEALARFRREHPGYAIPPATWDQVKPR